MIKFRLGHSVGRSYLVPEVLIAVGGTRFFLPSFFGPPFLGFNVAPDQHILRFSLDTGAPRATELARIVVDVRSQDRLRIYEDGAQLYRCTFDAPRPILRFASGFCRALPDGDYALSLFHHTTPSAAREILASGELWSSAWNLAGTRKLKNVAYAYFTPLTRITSEADLQRIAMASEGTIHLQTTSERVREDALTLRVYRGNTTQRTTPLPFYVPTRLVAPAPLFFHPMVGSTPAYFEIVGPEIVRVGLQPKRHLSIGGSHITAPAADLKRFDYLVLGDASTVRGLAAPYDEEETEEVTHLERLVDQDVFQFWWARQNSDLVSGRMFESRTLQEGPESGS